MQLPTMIDAPGDPGTPVPGRGEGPAVRSGRLSTVRGAGDGSTPRRAAPGSGSVRTAPP